MNILITSASRKVSLIKSFQEALREEGNGQVIAVDVSALAPALYFADTHYLVPHSNEPEFLKVLVCLCQQHEVRLVVPTRDEELAVFARHRERFAEVGTTVLVPSEKTVNICQDKHAFVRFCHQHGFATPVSYDLTNLPAQLSFPLFVRPRTGKGGRQAVPVDSQQQLELLCRQINAPLVQEFLSCAEYTVDVFADFSGRVISSVPRERLTVVGGEAVVSRTSKNPLLIDEATRLATALELIGHNTIQCFLDNDKVKFIEVNPRFGGAAHLGFAAGAPTPQFLVKLLKGEALTPNLGTFRDNYVMLRYGEDFFLEGEAVIEQNFQ